MKCMYGVTRHKSTSISILQLRYGCTYRMYMYVYVHLLMYISNVYVCVRTFTCGVTRHKSTSISILQLRY